MHIQLGKLMHSRALILAAASGLLTFAAGMVAGSSAMKVYIDGKPFAAKPGWRVEEGRVVGPVAPVARALGASAALSRDGGTLDLWSPSPWMLIAHEHAWGASRPYDFDALGPIMAVRHLLSERQWRSLEASNGPEPRVLARFEIVDAFYTEMPGGMPWPGGKLSPVVVTAILYWASLDPSRPVPRTGLRQIYAKNAQGQEAYYLDGPRAVTADIDRVEFTVQPVGASFGKPADLVIPGAVDAESLILGTDGWSAEQEKVVSSQKVEVPNHNNVVPLYDPSVPNLPKGSLPLATAGRPRVWGDPWGSGSLH